jgi:hypothetical protein
MPTATSGEKPITIEGKKYAVRTQIVYQNGLGVQGTLSTTAPIKYIVQYKPGPSVENPIPEWVNLGERDVSNKNNWIFTAAAGNGFKKELVKNGPSSLTTSLDDASANALSKSSNTTKQQSINALQTAPNVAPTVTGTQPVIEDTIVGGSGGEESTTQTPLESGPISTTIADREEEKYYGDFRYPKNISEDQDRILFTVKTYGVRKLDNLTVGEKFKLGQRGESKVLGRVVLPIQPSITDSNGVDWGGSTLNPIQAYAASLSLDIAASGNITEAASQALNQSAEAFKQNLGSYAQAMKIYFAQEAVGAQNLLSRTSGAIINPNLELLFNGPTLRPFNFTFKLSPRNSQEAIEVKKIINLFKKGMAVKAASSEVFLKAPNIFSIQYQSGEGKEHLSLNKIKECALLGCDVDYTPDGTYMTFNDEERTMTSYQISLRFSEIDPIYNNDYNSDLGTGVGY